MYACGEAIHRQETRAAATSSGVLVTGRTPYRSKSDHDVFARAVDLLASEDLEACDP